MKKILLILVIAIAGFLGVAAMQPDEFRVTRSATINAPVEQVYAMINVHRAWNEWSPWAKLDPNAKFTYEGPESGVGSITHWQGNSEVGAGTSTITESNPNELIRLKLEFREPMEATNTAEFTFKSESPTATQVTWTMYGKNNLLGKAIGLVMDCEKMVGEQFEKGLANIKAIAEKPAIIQP